jgi:flagellar assembly protein FliH
MLPRVPAERFVYPAAQSWTKNGPPKADSAHPGAFWGSALEPGPAGIPEEEVQAREEKARAQGREEGRLLAQKELDRTAAAIRAGVAEALQAFRAEREAYFQRVEAEVVRLALSIARKILHRESQMDPALLAGIVRVAMEKFEAATTVRLRVPPGQERLWQEALGSGLKDAAPVEIIAENALAPGQCVLETQMGSTEVGLEAQLKEIEQGFFDLLAQRPGGAS